MQKLNLEITDTVRESYNSKREKIIETGRRKACPYNPKENKNNNTDSNEDDIHCRGTVHRARIENGINIKFISILKNARTTVGAGLDSAYEHEREKIIDKTGTVHRAPTGITLIALIITVIVLLILAGVALNFVLEENGILRHAEFAKNKYQNAAEKEEADLNTIEGYLNENNISQPIKKHIEAKVNEILKKIGVNSLNVEQILTSENILLKIKESENAKNYINVEIDNFSQPKLTSAEYVTEEGTINVYTNSQQPTYQAYKAFNNEVANSNNNNFYSMNTTDASYIKVVYPYKILITGIDLYSRPSDGYSSQKRRCNSL